MRFLVGVDCFTNLGGGRRIVFIKYGEKVNQLRGRGAGGHSTMVFISPSGEVGPPPFLKWGSPPEEILFAVQAFKGTLSVR